MISNLSENYNRFDFVGLSTDDKNEILKAANNQLANGTIFFEMDTQDLYMWDKENQVWVNITSVSEVI